MTTKRDLQRAGVAAVLTFGLTALVAVLPGPAFLVPAVAIVGWFLVTPVLAMGLLSGEPSRTESTGRERGDASDPLSTLQDRYAAGEISEAEFERRVERILESDAAADEAGVERDREPELELERE
jgi:uncharacterized membrane protein